MRKYAHALEFLDPDKDFAEPAKTASRDIQRSCNLNLAAAHLKLGDNAEAIKAASKVLTPDPNPTPTPTLTLPLNPTLTLSFDH